MQLLSIPKLKDIYNTGTIQIQIIAPYILNPKIPLVFGFVEIDKTFGLTTPGRTTNSHPKNI